MKPHLLHVFSTFVAAGPQVRTVRLLEALGDEYRHSIVALDGRTEARSLFSGQVETEILPAPPRAGTVGTLRRMRALYRELRPDLVLTYNWGAIEALLACRGLAPALHHEDGFRPDEVEGFKLRRVLVRRLFLPGAKGLIVPSGLLADLARQLWKLPAGKVHWIPNGLAVEDFRRADGHAARRAELGIPAEAVVAGAVGHLRPEKNVPRLLRAAARSRLGERLHLLVLGDGPEREHIEGTARELGLTDRVHLVGHREDPRDDYRTMDLFALTSDTEQMPVALLEAMASSLPVVATDVGDVARVLPAEQRDKVVSLDEADPVEGLARVLDALGELDERHRLGSLNAEHVRAHYDFGRMVDAYRERYEAARRS